MKILYHHRIASKDGQYVHIEELIHSLRQLGHELVIVEPAQLTRKSFGKSSGAVQNLRAFLPGFIHEFIEFCYSFLDFYKLAGAIRQHRPDCIYERYNIFFISGILAKKIFRLPLLLEVNAPLYRERSQNHGIHLKRLAEWSEKFAWKNADYVLPVTQVLADMVVAAGADPARCVVIPNGINPHSFSARHDGRRIREALQLQDKLVLGFVGFVRKWHRLERVLTVIHNHRDQNWHLLLIGDGPAREELVSQAAALGIADRVSFVGVVDRDEVADYVGAFDIALQPDVVEYASPLKLFEYMMLARAILAPDRRNIQEILTDGRDALLFNPEDEAAFASRLEQLCTDPALRARLGEGARQTITEKQLFWDENARKIQNLFLQLLAAP